jgi:hypothetical protein
MSWWRLTVSTRAFGVPGLRNGVLWPQRHQRPSKGPAQAYRPNLGVTSRAVTDTFVLDGPPHLVPSSVKRTTPRWLYATGQERSETRGLP